MNVMLTKLFDVASVVISERYESPRIAPYHVTVDMTTNTTDNGDLNLAFARMRYWFYAVMQDAFLISAQHPDLRAWQATNSRLLVFPEDPVDQLVGIMLYRKLDAMVEDRLLVTRVSISSPLDEDMIYHHDADEAQGAMSQDGWWADGRPTWHDDSRKPRNRGKVISLTRQAEWKDHDLDWDEVSEPHRAVVTDFNRDAD